jgi:hypothetical protein
VSRRRDESPRRLADILAPALGRLTSGKEARAYAVWSRAAGAQVAGTTLPRAFSRGVLTIECDSSVWANELTYLSGAILARMQQVDPGHPVQKLRFKVRRHERVQEEAPAAAKTQADVARLGPEEVATAWSAAEGVADDRLRAAIRGALRTAVADPGGESGETPDRHPQK